MPALASPVVSTTPRYPIRVVAARVGLTEMTVRAWERRHGAVAPARSTGGQRLFSDADIERLTLLRALTAQGTSISALAPLATAALRRMAPELAAAPEASERVVTGAASALAGELSTCRRAVVALDGAIASAAHAAHARARPARVSRGSRVAAVRLDR